MDLAAVEPRLAAQRIPTPGRVTQACKGVGLVCLPSQATRSSSAGGGGRARSPGRESQGNASLRTLKPFITRPNKALEARRWRRQGGGAAGGHDNTTACVRHLPGVWLPRSLSKFVEEELVPVTAAVSPGWH